MQSHASNLLLLPNGDLLCAWFGGLQEGIPDISIYLARLPAKTNTCLKPQKLTHDNTRSKQNPVLFLTSSEHSSLWLMYTSQDGVNQESAVVKKQVSQDMGLTWSSPSVLFGEPGTFIRQPMMVLPSGAWTVPVFYCGTPAGYKWSSTSSDGINWTQSKPTTFLNPNSGIGADVLSDGRVIVVYNDSSANSTMARRKGLYDDIAPKDDVRQNQPVIYGKEAFWGAPRAPLSLAISSDGGKSWTKAGVIEDGDGFCMTNDSKDKLNRELSYPSIALGPSGEVHIAFTFWRQKIKYVKLDEKTLLQ